MAKYTVFDLKEKQTTKYDYEIGETITVNSNLQYKCMNIVRNNDNIYYMFNRGKVIYIFNEIKEEEIEDFIKNINS